MSIVFPLFKQRAVSTVDWNALYAEHIKRIYNFFRYRVGDEATAEDLTAITFEKAWKKRQQFKGDSSAFVYWLYAIARNVANDHFRKQPNLVALENLASLEHDGNIADEVADRIEFGRLVTFIQQLSLRESDIITLKYGAGLTNREIAKQLRLSESNVGSILHRAIQTLRRKMELD